MKKPSLYCTLLLAFGIGCLPLFSAGNAETNTDTHTLSDKSSMKTDSDTVSAREDPKKTADGGKDKPSPNSAQLEKKDDAAALHKEAVGKPDTAPEYGGDNAGTEKKEDGVGEDGKESPDEPKKNDEVKTPEVSFASIQNKGLTVAEGNKWYYENFDRLGRSAFAVVYEKDVEIEKTVWSYHGESRHPSEKNTYHTDGRETVRYDEAGRTLLIETYNKKGKLLSTTENTYNDKGKLIMQLVTAGKNTDKSVWDFVGDKAVSQTKYRNGKKTAFIELHSATRIVHLYVDDKEVLVTEEK